MLDPGLASVVLRSGKKGPSAHTERQAVNPQAVQANPAMGDWGYCDSVRGLRALQGVFWFAHDTCDTVDVLLYRCDPS